MQGSAPPLVLSLTAPSFVHRNSSYNGPGALICPGSGQGRRPERIGGRAELQYASVSLRSPSGPMCGICGRRYKTMSAVYRHRKTCCVRDRPQGVRQHEELAQGEVHG